MRAFVALSCLVLGVIGVGVVVGGASAPSVYRVSGHFFSAVFPGSPVVFDLSSASGLEWHGATAPPLFEVLSIPVRHLTGAGVAYEGSQLPPLEAIGAFGTEPEASSTFRIELRVPTDVAIDLPATETVGSWQMPPIDGFHRTLSIHLAGPPTFRFWWTVETLSNSDVLWSVSAQSTDYGAARAFVQSFVPIS